MLDIDKNVTTLVFTLNDDNFYGRQYPFIYNNTGKLSVGAEKWKNVLDIDKNVTTLVFILNDDNF